MRDALVEIAEWADGGLAARLFRCRVNNKNFHYAGAMTFQPLKLDLGNLPPLDTIANVSAYGNKIHDALSNHPAIGAELTQIFGAASPNLLKFFSYSALGEQYRWEALCRPAPSQFLAHSCAVTRLASMNDNDPDIRPFTGTVRMAAFLSAAGDISAKDEFESIAKEVTIARNAGLVIECKIYLGEQELLDQAAKDVAAGKYAGVEVAPIPVDTAAMEKLLQDRPVEILHFFCHGITTAGVRALELATINDKDIESETGSLFISLERLNKILELNGAIWITVLNSCSGAKVMEQLHSMARTLTERSPFTVGMAEPIAYVDAAIFSDAFYGKLFSLMQASLVGLAQNSIAVLDCASAVIAARCRVHGKYAVAPPDAFGRWTLPLLYERGSPLMVKRVRAIDPQMRLRIDTVAEALRNLPPTTPPPIRQRVLALLDDEPKVPAEFRPDAFGVIGAA